ncbi:hypothetical protein [Rahnella perminowiae]|uniref:hypothetical protein n=1 Tax=Rahnella perminowiae TaxID=2816244 RepID=UPI00215C3ED7|nr:hypothetical protein [Rahnella perminowiae]MCR8998583.1 hypothetical protein [Rahnella perminowiae]
MTIEVQIITSVAPFVKSETAKKHPRLVREPLKSQDITVQFKALGRHIAKCQRKRQSVRVPAMRASDLGQVLRTLELKRAYA